MTLDVPAKEQTLDELSINTIRFLAVDAVQKANSGHPGLPLGAAAMAYALWTRYLRFQPAQPELAGSGSVRAVGGSWFDAAVRAVVLDRLRCEPGRY